MTPKTVIGLGVVTAVAVVAAGFSIASQYGGTQQTRIEEPVVEGLEDRINDVAKIVVKSSSDEFTVVRGDKGWTVPEEDGYPADQDLVRRTLYQLSQLRLIEPKTTMEERYPRLQVEDVAAEDAKSALLTVSDGSGGEIASLIVGKVKMSLAGSLGGGVYLRRNGEKQSWLAEGELVVRSNAVDWVDEDVVDVASGRIQSVTTTSSDGAVLRFSREATSDKDFQVEGLPEGKSLKKDALKDLAGVLSNTRLSEVAAASNKPFDAAKTVKAEVATFDGLIVGVSLQKGDDGIWASFEARAAEGSSDAAAAEAKKVNDRVSGWVYKISEGQIGPLLKKPEDLVES